MATNPFVSSIVSTAPVGAARPGYGIPLILSYNADAFGSDRVRHYSDLDEIVADGFSTTGHEYVAANAMWSQAEPRPKVIAIGRGALKPTLRYAGSVATLTPGDTYVFPVAGDGVTSTDVSVALPLADLAYTSAEVSTAADTITITGHGLATGDLLRLTTGGTLLTATGVAADTNLWAIVVDDDTIQLATSRANALAGTEVDITNAGSGTTTVKLTSNDVLVARIVEALNLVTGKNYTAAVVTGSGDTDTFTVTLDTAGKWASIGYPLGKITLAQNHADPGIATDLAAIAADPRAWYELHTFFNSSAMVLAAAAWIESASPRRTYRFTLSESLSFTGALGGGGIGDSLKSLAYARTFVECHPVPAQMLGEALAGRILPLDPGRVSAAHKALVGVTPVDLTSTYYANLLAKNLNSYGEYDGARVSFFGKSPSGEWWDVVRNDDYHNSELRASLMDALTANDIIHYDDDGLGIAEGVLRAELDKRVSQKIYRDVKVSVVELVDTTAPDRTARRYKGLKWSATRVGAIVFLEASGTVSA